jgi:hypothetical protein
MIVMRPESTTASGLRGQITEGKELGVGAGVPGRRERPWPSSVDFVAFTAPNSTLDEGRAPTRQEPGAR